MKTEIIKKYGNRVRLRVCGLCWNEDQLLMVNHSGISPGDFWAPPGGGVEFGQASHHSLVREFQEETGLTVTVGQFRFACEFLNHPLHALEMFFEVFKEKGELKVGNDPESEAQNQIITDVKWMSYKQIRAIPAHERHGIFRFAETASEMKKLNGFYRI